jgi:hypothetical protein
MEVRRKEAKTSDILGQVSESPLSEGIIILIQGFR